MTAGEAAASPDRTGRGILLLVGGIFVFSGQDIIVRTVSGTYPVMEFVFIRTLFSILPVLAIVALDGGLASLRIRRPGLHAVRGVLMFMGYTTYFLAVASAPLATVVAIFFSAPLFVTALSALVLREPVGVRRWAAVGIGFGGVLLILQPGGADVLDPGAFIAVLSALFYAASVMFTRRLGRDSTGAAMVASQTVVYLAIATVAGLTMQDIAVEAESHAAVQFMLRGWVVPTAFDLGLMALSGLIAAAGFYGLTQAYRIASPSAVAPFEYTGMIWGIVWGYTFWGEIPDPLTWAGIAVIVLAGIYVIHREAMRGRTPVTGKQLRQRL